MSFDILARQLTRQPVVHQITGKRVDDTAEDHPMGLTAQQCKVLSVLADAHGMTDAAARLGMSYRAITMTLMRLRAKTGKTTLQLVVQYDRLARGDAA